ncbi:hypothetical protein D3C80_1824660 [compost metagenome]
MEEVISTWGAKVEFGMKFQWPVHHVTEVLGTMVFNFAAFYSECQLGGVGVPTHR